MDQDSIGWGAAADADLEAAQEEQSERSRNCQTCGKYGPVWAVWSKPVKMDFVWQCQDCRHDPEKRYN